jgi:hypothetical protein
MLRGGCGGADEVVLPLSEGAVEVIGVAMVSVFGAQSWRVVL